MSVALIDSNIIIYGYDKSDIEKNKVAVTLLKKCWQKKATYALSLQNLSEFFWNITKKVKKPLDKTTAYFLVMEFISFSNWEILKFNEKTILLSIKISNKFNMDYWDSLLAATMKENKITKIYTENEKYFKVPGIKAINPFKKCIKK